MGRHSHGATLAGLALAGAAIAAAAECPALMWVLIAIAVLLLVGTYADRLPLLHRLPGVGASPPPAVTFHLEGHGGMTFQMHGQPHEVILCVGIKNDQRDEITRVNYNAYAVGSEEILRCQQDGSPYPGDAGLRLRGPDAPYWSQSGITLPPDALVFFFKLTIPKPGVYPVYFKLWSPEFYGKGDKEYRDTITVLGLE